MFGRPWLLDGNGTVMIGPEPTEVLLDLAARAVGKRTLLARATSFTSCTVVLTFKVVSVTSP